MSRFALVFQSFDGFHPVLSILTSRCEKLGVEYLKAVLEADGHVVDLFDNELTRIPTEDLVGLLSSRCYEVIGFSINAGNYHSSVSVIEKLPSGPLVIAGGVVPTLHDRELLLCLPRIDGVILGEGENAVLGLAHWADSDRSGKPRIDGFVTRESPEPPLPPPLDMNTLPQLRHADVHRYEQTVMNTARGCRYACSYCSESRFLRKAGAKWHARCAEHVLEEIEYLVSTKGTRSLWIVDGDFIGPEPQRVSEICEAMLREGIQVSFEIDARADDIDKGLFALLYDAGLRRVFIGVESLSGRKLKRMNKGIRPRDVGEALRTLETLGIRYTLGMIPFTEDTTYEELAQDVIFMREHGFENIGSHLFMGMKDYGTLEPKTPQCFDDGRVAAIFSEGRELETRLNWSYAARIRKVSSVQERARLVYEINHQIGQGLVELVAKYGKAT